MSLHEIVFLCMVGRGGLGPLPRSQFLLAHPWSTLAHHFFFALPFAHCGSDGNQKQFCMMDSCFNPAIALPPRKLSLSTCPFVPTGTEDVSQFLCCWALIDFVDVADEICCRQANVKDVNALCTVNACKTCRNAIFRTANHILATHYTHSCGPLPRDT